MSWGTSSSLNSDGKLARLGCQPERHAGGTSRGRTSGGRTADGQNVGVEPHEARLALDGASRVQDLPAADGIGPAGLEVAQHPAWALDAQDLHRREAGLPHLVFELLRQVEVG